jgi:hypothetical protein
VHTTTITKADRAALENLWGQAGTWAADTWTRLNTKHFDGQLRYHGIVWGLTPHGKRLVHTRRTGRITLHPALLDPQSADPWDLEELTDIEVLGAAYATDILLHEMVHLALFADGVEHADGNSHHNTQEWCDQIMRITPQLGLDPVKAEPVKPRRIRTGDGESKAVRKAFEGHLSRAQIARWPHTLRPAGYYTANGRIHVPI